jgi:hypothetical protein
VFCFEIHKLCLRTLRAVHPQAEINLWSMTSDPNVMEAFVKETYINLMHYDTETFFAGLPEDAVKGNITTFVLC